ncbi:MAG: SGNH/GDSL hydrolase family protein [Patescibacteria group bacterium]|jgi:lysophospholipase L1-like esterase|nr:SGNH/GDSL hydrolase family protein [Patescibacteria group bacterium]
MKQFFILGACVAYGVGSSDGGWASLLKQYLHEKMYSSNGVGEKYEVFNFAKPGATIDFVIKTFPEQFNNYGRNENSKIIVSVGGNNSKATGKPDDYVSTLEEYENQVKKLILMLQKYSNNIIFANNGYVDESKTNPKINPFDGSNSYSTNSRRLLFRTKLKQICDEYGVTFADVNVSQKDWIKEYLYKDGLHPNNKGHRLIFEKIKQSLSL